MSSDGGNMVTDDREQARGHVPKLRFSEFRNAGDWKLRKLNELLSEPKLRNRDLEYGPEHVLSVSGEHGCVNQIEFMGRSYAGVTVKDYHVVRAGDVVYTKSPLKIAPYGIIKANKGADGIVSTLYAVYRPTSESSAIYIDHYFSSAYNLNSYLQPLVKKGPKNDMKVSNWEVLTGTIYVPDRAEQQKVADCLSSLDEVIAAAGKRLVALREYKKGLMQLLFPRPERIEHGEKVPAETIPRLRFPEFRDAGEWEQTPFNALFTIGSGRDYSHLSPGEIPVYGSGGLMTTVSDYLYDGESACIGRKGTINRPIFLTGKFWTVDTLFYTHSFNGVTPYFVYLLFQNIEWLAHNEAGGVPSLSKTNIEKITVAVPSADEQQRISTLLSALESLIDDQSSQVTALKAHKSGLMQQLFLSPDEARA